MALQALKTVAIKLTTKVDTKGLDKAEKKSKQLINTIKKLGAAIGVAFSVKAAINILKTTVDTADALAKQARAAGITIAKLEEMRFVYDHLGVSGDMALKAASKFFTYLGERAKPTEDALKQIGLTFADFKGLDRVDALNKLLVATAASSLTASQKLAILKKSVGDDLALELEKALKQGPEAFQKALNDFVQSGGPAFAKYGDMAEEVKDQFGNIGNTIDHVKVAFTQAFLGNNTEEAKKRGKQIGDAFLKIAENMDNILRVAGAIAAALALFQLGSFLGGVIATFKWVAKLAPLFGWIGKIVLGLTAPAWGWVAAIAAVVAGVVLLWKNWDFVVEKVKSAWEWIKKITTGFGGKVMEFFGFGGDSTPAPSTTFSNPQYYPPSVTGMRGSGAVTNNNSSSMVVNVDARGQNPAQTVDQIEKLQRRTNRYGYVGG